MGRKLTVFMLAIVILLQALTSAVLFAAKNDVAVSPALFCLSDTLPEGTEKTPVSLQHWVDSYNAISPWLLYWCGKLPSTPAQELGRIRNGAPPGMANGAFDETQGAGKVAPNENGYFGNPGQSSSSSVRNMPGGTSGATKFYNNVTEGYVGETIYSNGTQVRTMPDGTNITYRPTSLSDGTPVVDINNGSMYKSQKVHFVP